MEEIRRAIILNLYHLLGDVFKFSTKCNEYEIESLMYEAVPALSSRTQPACKCSDSHNLSVAGVGCTF